MVHTHTAMYTSIWACFLYFFSKGLLRSFCMRMRSRCCWVQRSRVRARRYEATYARASYAHAHKLITNQCPGGSVWLSNFGTFFTSCKHALLIIYVSDVHLYMIIPTLIQFGCNLQQCIITHVHARILYTWHCTVVYSDTGTVCGGYHDVKLLR